MQAKQTRSLAHSMVSLNKARSALAALALALVVGAASGCQTKALNASYGLRYKEMQAAQLGARGTHEPQCRGEEGAVTVGAYYQSLSGDTPGGGGGGGGGGGLATPGTTAGVKPLVH